MNTSTNKPETDQEAAIVELEKIRGSIDNIDAAVIHMLAERFKCTQRVGILKAHNDLAASDPDREQRQIARLRKLAADAGNNIITLDKAATQEWRKIAQPVYDEWVADMNSKGKDGQAILDEARMLIDKYTK